MAESKRRFFLLDENGKPTEGLVGIDGGVPGDGEYIKVKADGVIETSNPLHIAQLQTYAGSDGHPVNVKKESS